MKLATLDFETANGDPACDLKEVGSWACKDCGIHKPDTEYYFVSRGPKRQGKRRKLLSCKSCHSINTRKYREKTADRKNTLAKERYHKNKEAISKASKIRYASKSAEDKKVRSMRNRLRHKYRLSLNEFVQMSEKQGGRCLICGIHAARTKQKLLYVDHCHTTGKVRGLLCSSCNYMLGHAKDRMDVLINGAIYLEASK